MLTEFEMSKVVQGVSYKDWTFHLGQMGNGFYLQLQWESEDNFNPGKSYDNRGRKWYLSPHMTHSEIVFTAWAAVEFAELHEAREQFKYCGQLVFNPHVDVYALIAAGDKVDIRET